MNLENNNALIFKLSKDIDKISSDPPFVEIYSYNIIGYIL